jgi:Asp-tRNA(Asn)/Glu-tRNA(Gln) amidotransferase A subunit family amidase
VYERFVNELRALGAELVAIAIPPAPPTPAPAPEAVLLHRDLFQAKGHLYSPPMREQVAAQQANAGSVTALALYEAQVRRGQWIRDLQQLLADRRVDVIVQPSQNLETPLRRGSDEAGDVGRFGDSALRGLWNSAGFPAMSVPGGLSAETGLPVGMQFIGAPWTDASLLQVAVDYQARTEHHTLAPERWS